MKSIGTGITHTEINDAVGHCIVLKAPTGKHFFVEPSDEVQESDHFYEMDEFEDPASIHRYMALEDVKRNEDGEFDLFDCAADCVCKLIAANPKRLRF